MRRYAYNIYPKITDPLKQVCSTLLSGYFSGRCRFVPLHGHAVRKQENHGTSTSWTPAGTLHRMRVACAGFQWNGSQSNCNHTSVQNMSYRISAENKWKWSYNSNVSKNLSIFMLNFCVWDLRRINQSKIMLTHIQQTLLQQISKPFKIHVSLI